MGLQFTSIGMGTYLGDPDFETDRLVSDAVKESVTSGAVNVIDTAINYRFQKAERAVGKALAELFANGKLRRDQIFISTKNGYLTHDGDLGEDFWEYVHRELIKPGVIKPEDIASQSHCMTVPYLKDQLGRSLANLGLDCVDLMYLHNAAESQIVEVGKEEFFLRLESAFKFYEEKRQEGRISFYGMATWTCFRTPPSQPEHLSLEEVVSLARTVGDDVHGFRFIQLPFNLAMPEALTLENQQVNGERMTILEAAAKLGVGVFTSAPLLHGQIANHPKVPRLPGLSSALSCLQFARSAPGVLAPLVGHKHKENVKENLSIASVPPLSAEEFERTFVRQQ